VKNNQFSLASLHQRKPEMPYETHRQRLYLLRGMPCPLCPSPSPGWKVCPTPLHWTGVSLTCEKGHGWSNLDALHEDFQRLMEEE
jgi:hypothetical protein